MNVLVTGAPGFIGANLTRRLISDGHSVHVLLHPGHDTWRLNDVLTDVHTHETVLADDEAVDQLVREVRPEWVFHLAAHGAYPTQTDYREMILTNVLGTMNLIEACVRLGCDSVVNAGSSSEYGFKDHAPHEDERLDPNSHYAVTKAAATMYCRHAAVSKDANVVSLRLYSVYGPFEEPARLWPTLLIHALRGWLPTLVGPDRARDFVYVDDAVEAFLQAASATNLPRGSVFNVGSGRQTTLRELVGLVRRELGVAAEPSWGSMQDREWDTSVWVSDVSRIAAKLGWQPRTSLQEGLRLFVGWLKGNRGIRRAYERAIRPKA